MKRKPEIFQYESTLSTMDCLYDLIKEKKAEPWDSVVAKIQLAGRGQARKPWISLEGNLFASIFLPRAEPFDSMAAPVALGAMLALALRNLGYSVAVKWPNDIIAINDKRLRKICGILLEDKEDCVIAGIGINLSSAPAVDELEFRPEIEPGFLRQIRPGNIEPFKLWLELSSWIYEKHAENFFSEWKTIAENILIWKNEKVEWTDGKNVSYGILRGLSSNGGALIETDFGLEEKICGSLSAIS